MNEYGQILLWRFTYGKTLEEVKGSLLGLVRRYKEHGFSSPLFVTTYNCCHERNFWKSLKDETSFFSSVASAMEAANRSY